MKASKGIIGFLSGLFSIAHIVMMAMAVFVFISLILNFVSEDTGLSYSEEYTIINKTDVSPSLTKEYKLLYSLSTETKKDEIYIDTLDEIKIVDNGLRGKIVGGIRLILLYILALFFIKELRKIFNSLDNSIKNKVWFHIDNYYSIKILAYLIAGIFFVEAGLSTIYYFLLNDVIVNGIQVYLIPTFPIFSTAWSVAILLVIAHVYKEGIQLREEQDLTI